MIEVDQNSLRKGKYYLILKEYKDYHRDMVIGEFIAYDDDHSNSQEALLKNYVYFEVQSNLEVRIFTEIDDNSYSDIELSSPDHVTCWAFELTDEEIEKHVLMEYL